MRRHPSTGLLLLVVSLFVLCTPSSGVEFIMVPVQADGPPGDWTLAGPNGIILYDTDMVVEAEVYVEDWGRLHPGKSVVGCQTQLDCAGYVNDSPGQLTAVRATYEGNYVPFQMGVDESREDYLFYFYGEGRFSACSDNCACSNGPGPSVVGRHACMSATLSGGTADDGSRFYLNHFSFYVPPGALGTYVVGLAEQDTNIATATQEALLPANFTPLRIEVATGACCVPQESQTECLETTRKPCRDMGGIWVEGCSCDPDDWNFVCCWDFECGTDAHCADGDGCTINRCAIGDLDYMPPFCQDPIPIELGAGECCDPSVEMGSLADTDGLGAIAPLDDGNDCTEGYCDAPGTCALGDQCGAVQQSSAAAYTPCDTEEPCMTDGVCDGEGICLATDINTIPCTRDEDCVFPETPDGQCDYVEGHCICREDTPLSLVVQDEYCCFDPQEEFDVTVVKGARPEPVTGGQFVITWDPACVEFVDWDTAEDYPLVLFDQVTNTASLAIIAVGIELGDEGVSEAVDMAHLRFRRLAGCAACEICFGESGNAQTRLVDSRGLPVPLAPQCSCEISARGEAVFSLPDSVYTHTPCDGWAADVTWDAPQAHGMCGGEIDVNPDDQWGTADDLCYAVGHEPIWKCTDSGRACGETNPAAPECTMFEGDCLPGLPMTEPELTALIEHGGAFGQGTTTFCCSMDLACHTAEEACWQVEVSHLTPVDVEVQYTPFMPPTPLQRCVEFNLSWDYFADSIIWREDIVFGASGDLPGTATATIAMQRGTVRCLSAKDPYHTLAAVAEAECGTDGRMHAVFAGDRDDGGTWLVGGNLDGNHRIDVLDFAVLVTQYGMAIPPHRPCDEESTYHADINGDGMVDVGDFAQIATNYLMVDMPFCQLAGVAEAEPVTEISVKELRAIGLDELTVADLNHDGLVNGDDMAALMSGTMPPRAKRPGRSLR